MHNDTAAVEVANVARGCVDKIAANYETFPWEDKRVYATWLAQTYYYVRHASRLLSFAAARCSLADEVLHRIFLKGIQEEQGHEQLAVRDLRTLGELPENFGELHETAAYHQTLYYAIEHDGPAALFGYFLPPEGLAALKMQTALQRIRETYSDAGASFVIVHCELDVNHFEDGLKTLSLLSPDKLQVVKRTLDFSTALYIQMIERIMRSVT